METPEKLVKSLQRYSKDIGRTSKDFIHCSVASIVDFEQVNADWSTIKFWKKPRRASIFEFLLIEFASE